MQILSKIEERVDVGHEHNHQTPTKLSKLCYINMGVNIKNHQILISSS